MYYNRPSLSLSLSITTVHCRPILTHKLAASFHCKPAYDPPSVVPIVSTAASGAAATQDGDGTTETSPPAALGGAGSIPRAPAAAASSKLLIRSGRIIEQADAAAPLQPQHRLQILMAVKVSVMRVVVVQCCNCRDEMHDALLISCPLSLAPTIECSRNIHFCITCSALYRFIAFAELCGAVQHQVLRKYCAA